MRHKDENTYTVAIEIAIKSYTCFLLEQLAKFGCCALDMLKAGESQTVG